MRAGRDVWPTLPPRSQGRVPVGESLQLALGTLQQGQPLGAQFACCCSAARVNSSINSLRPARGAVTITQNHVGQSVEG